MPRNSTCMAALAFCVFIISESPNTVIKKEDSGACCFHNAANDVPSEANKSPEQDEKQNILPLFPKLDVDEQETVVDVDDLVDLT